MATFQERFRYRAVETAVYRGTPYHAGGSERIKPFISLIPEGGDPVPVDLEPYGTGEDTVYLVHPDQLDSWYRSTWTFTWQGEPFRCIGASGTDAVYGAYTGSNVAFADEHLQRTGAIEYEGRAPLAEVELTEHRENLLAVWRARQTR